jgi:predicted MPP superfamily phosphohydrolase
MEDQPVAGTTRRRLLTAAGGLVAAAAGAGIYARWIEPTWIDVVALDLPVPRLPAAWDGVRVGLVADLHHGPRVPLDYLAKGIDRLAALKPDLVAAVGDFVTAGGMRYAEPAARLMERLAPPMGVFACLGNHDYGVTRPVRRAEAQEVAETLPRAGVRLLRNEAVRLERDGEAIWVAGTEDLWSGHIRPTETLADVPQGAANITLCHNPDAAEPLVRAGAGAILSGHTHGGQVQVPLVGPPILPVRNRHRYEGLHPVGGAWLYINRGLGWLRKVRFACRPEITILTLRRAAAPGESAPSAPPE